MKFFDERYLTQIIHSIFNDIWIKSWLQNENYESFFLVSYAYKQEWILKKLEISREYLNNRDVNKEQKFS